MDAVKEYKKRRRARLAANILRLDDDEETNNQNQGKGNHGNTRIPFGLCQREGIQIGKGWTPKDAWNALEGKGYSASSVYSELKKTGKAKGSSESPKPKTSKEDFAKLKKAYKDAESPYEQAKRNREAQDQALANATKNLDEVVQFIERDDMWIERYKERLHAIDAGYGTWDKQETQKMVDYWVEQKDRDAKILAERQKYRDAAIKAQTDAANKENELKSEYDKAKEAYIAPIKESPEYEVAKKQKATEEELRFARIDYTSAEKDRNYYSAQKASDESTIKRYKEIAESPTSDEVTRKLYSKWLVDAEQRLAHDTAELDRVSKRFADARARVERLEKKPTDTGDHDKEMLDDAKAVLDEEDTVKETSYSYLTRASSRMKDNKVPYNPVHKLSYTPSEEEAIAYIGGGDKTGGSCVSCGMAYLACKAGYNVLDFRGGASKDIMSVEDRRVMMALGGRVETDKDGFKATHRILDTVEDGGKEYFFCTGSHAAIVKKVDGKLMFLELQDPTTNGWFPLDDNVLKRRFRCLHSARSGYARDRKCHIIEAEKLTESDEFISLMGYINTEPSKQKKGGDGVAS